MTIGNKSCWQRHFCQVRNRLQNGKYRVPWEWFDKYPGREKVLGYTIFTRLRIGQKLAKSVLGGLLPRWLITIV